MGITKKNKIKKDIHVKISLLSPINRLVGKLSLKNKAGLLLIYGETLLTAGLLTGFYYIKNCKK